MPNNRIDDLLNMGAGSEAQMLGVEGERTAFPGSNSPRGMSMREYWDVFPEEEPGLMKAAEGYVDFFDPNRPLKWFMDLMDEYGGLKEESERIIEKSLSTEEAQAEMDDELSQYSSGMRSFLRGEGLSSEGFPPEVMEILDDIAIGMVDPGKKVKGIASMLDDLFDIMKRGKTMGKTSVKRSKESEKYWDDAADRSKQSRSDRIARENIEASKRSVSESTPEGTIRIERTIGPRGWRHDDPPKKLKGGGHLSYKKGYYGKRYK